MADIQHTSKFVVPMSFFDKTFMDRYDVDMNVTMEVVQEDAFTTKTVFRATLPKHIFEKVANKDVTFSKHTTSRNMDVLESVQFKKSSEEPKQVMTNENLQKLIEDMGEANLAAHLIHRFEAMEQGETADEKFIGFSFKAETEEKRTAFNMALLGTQVSIKFVWGIFFRQAVKANDLSMYNDEGIARYKFHSGEMGRYGGLRFHGHHGIVTTDPEGKDLIGENTKLIRWTKEREEFFRDVQEGFVRLEGRLNDFLRDVNEDNVEKLIADVRENMGAKLLN